MKGFLCKEFVPGKLKSEYELMNKIIHNMIGLKGKEKLPSKEETQFPRDLSLHIPRWLFLVPLRPQLRGR